MTTRVEVDAAKARAAEEKALAKQRLTELKASLRPSAIAGRLGRRTGASIKETVTAVTNTVRAHPTVAASVLTGLGMVLVAKPLGALLAEEFVDEKGGL